MATLTRPLTPGQARLVHSHGGLGAWHRDLIPVTEHDHEPDLIRVTDWRQETTFRQPDPDRLAGIVSSLGVSLRIGDRWWGHLLAHDTQPRHWREIEIDCLRSLVNILVAAVERSAGESSQAAIAELGQYSLRTRQPEHVLQRAVHLTRQVLDVPGCVLVRPSHHGYRVCHSSGAPDWTGEQPTATPPEAPRPHLVLPPAVIAEDLPDPTGETAPGPEHPHGIRSTLSVPVLVGGHLWARLVAHDLRPRRWRDGEVDLVQSLANVLALFLEHTRWRTDSATAPGNSRKY
jgi:GAF domain-containing protein